MIVQNATPPATPASDLPFGGVGVSGTITLIAVQVDSVKRFFRADTGQEVTGAQLNNVVAAPNAVLTVFPAT